MSYEEIFDCDVTSKGCKGGEVTKILGYGKRKGFIEESCYPNPGTCPEDHFLMNSCRSEKNVFRVIDHCLAEGVSGVQREIMKNGPVLAMITPFTDFLTFSDGTYMRTNDAFKLQGNHVVKVLGWENVKGNDAWIIENTWGEDWGQNGYGRISFGETMID